MIYLVDSFIHLSNGTRTRARPKWLKNDCLCVWLVNTHAPYDVFGSICKAKPPATQKVIIGLGKVGVPG